MQMTHSNGGGPQKRWRRYVKPVVTGLIVLGIVALVWHFAVQTAGVRRAEAPSVTTIVPLPPPPPPPPDVKPPPEKPQEETPTEKPTVAPKPSETPKPTDNLPKQVTMNTSAQAGADNFNIGAGDGGGMTGSGGGGTFGNASYSMYMVYVLQQAIEHDKQVQEAGGSHFTGSLNLWMEPDGRITKVVVVQSTGDTKLDAAVVNAILALGKVDQLPPPSTTYPVLVKLQGRQPG